MKKVLTALLVVISILVTSTFVGCKDNSTYYKITFTDTVGVEFVTPKTEDGVAMQSGAQVLSGYKVVFQVNIENGYCVEGDMVVKAGDTVLTADDDFNYSFVMSADTVITVDGVVFDTSVDDGEGDGSGDEGDGSGNEGDGNEGEGDGDGDEGGNEPQIPETTTHKLIYSDIEGVEFVETNFDGQAKVEEGKSVKFKVNLKTGYTGAYTVLVNGKAVYPDGDDFYTFAMPNSVTTVSVTGVTKMKEYNVTFSKGVDDMGVDGRVKYFCDLGDTEEGFSVYAGTELKFTVNVSSYYTDDFYIRKNTEIIEPDDDGVYTVYVTGHTDINAYGLEMDVAFTNRDDGGKGTISNPYKISKPIDLYYMAALINSDFYAGSGFNVAYYELTNDIDMEGEQLFVIGDTITSSAFFGGTFNGNGHTISNYYIEDSIIDQESYVGLFLPYIGMFGFVQPGANGAPMIYDLHLSDFVINIDASGAGSTFVAGGICGIAIGATISACSVTDATISADADYGYFGYMGGIVGVHQSYYFTDTLTRYYATISSCYTDVEITGDSGYVYGAGGIAGFMLSHEEKTNAYILNCYSTGNVSGAINTGGIVGIADSHTAIMNCYATGDVEAYSAIELTGTPDIDAYAYARAGGIVGDIGYSSVVADSFFTGNVYSSATAVGTEYAIKGEIAGKTAKDEEIVIDARKSHVVNAYGKSDKKAFNEELFKNVLGWDTQDWVFADSDDYADHRFANEDGYPVINYASADKTFTVTFNHGEKEYGGNKTHDVEITNTYIPMSYWAITYADKGTESVIPEFISADDGSRSYGYFFDVQLTQPVPHSFIPTGDITLYVGYADYSEVTGRYYLKTAQNGSGVYVEFDIEGNFSVVDGARKYTSYYTYDGKDMLLFYTTLARYANIDWTDQATVEGVMYYYYTFKATVEDGEIKIWDTVYFPQTACLVGLLNNDAFKYGTYYDGTGKYYTFNTDGTGIISGTTSDTFTYAVDEETVTITRNNVATTLTGTINANGFIQIIDEETVTIEDAFKGTWEVKATTHKEIIFDGKGNYEYVNYAYVLDGRETKKTVINEKSGTYMIVDSEYGITANLGEDGIAYFDYDNNVRVETSWIADTFYTKNSFVGTWYYSALKYEPVTLTLYGINEEGMGSAILRYSNNAEVYEVTYETVETNGKINIYVYEQDFDVAQLVFNPVENTLTGTFFSETKASYNENAIFVLYDDYKGEWLSTCDAFEVVEFNGLGAYNVKGSATNVAVKGFASVDGTTVSYVYDHATQSASMTYNDVEYTMVFNNGKILISDGNAQYELVRHDWLAGLTFKTEDGLRLIFDGKGYASVGGTVYTFDGTESINGRYVVNDGYCTIQVLAHIYYFGINVENGKWTLIYDATGEEQYVYVENAFTGDWVTSDSISLNVGQFNGYNLAEGTYNGNEAIVYIYNNLLSIQVETDDEVIYFEKLDNNTIVITDKEGEHTDILAIRAQNLDAFFGEFNDQSGNKIAFNGFGKSAYGTGTAIFEIVGAKKNIYEYVINEYGEAVIKTGKNEYYVTKICASDDEGAFTLGTISFKLVKLDEFYGYVAYDVNNVKYVFDGQGKVTTSDGMTYEYKRTGYDEEERVYTFEFINKVSLGGMTISIKYDAELDCSLSVYFITVTQREE